MLSIERPVSQLRLSRHNVRKNLHTREELLILGESIVSEGLRLPVQTHPMAGNGSSGRAADLFGVFAGGGRYRAIMLMIELGKLPADFPVRTNEYDDLSDGKLVLNSLLENDNRFNLHAFEKYSGIAKAHALGETIEEIAHSLGHETIEIIRWLRLGQLAKPVFDAFSAGEMSLDQAKAYGATPDHALQQAAFEALHSLADQHKKPSDIRAWMKFNDSVSERDLRFVGEEEYVNAGGGLQLDLFSSADNERRRLMHPAILRQLVDAKLAALKDDLRTRVGRELRFIVKPPQTDFDTDDLHLQVVPEELADGTIVLPEGDIVARVAIAEDGTADVTWWWSNRLAKVNTERPTAERPRSLRRAPPVSSAPAVIGVGMEAPTPATSADALGQDTIEIFRSIRRAVLRAALIQEAKTSASGLATDWIVFAQLRMLVDPSSRPIDVGATMPPLAGGPELARDYIEGMPATKLWGAAISELSNRPMLREASIAAAFLSYVGESQAIKDLAAAVLAGLTLERSLNSDDYHVEAHEELAALAGIESDADVREYWTPTSKLLDRLPVSQRLAIAEPFVEAAVFGPWQLLKGPEVTRQLLAVVTGTGAAVRAARRDDAERWVHPLLRFRTPAAANDQVGADRAIEEAAE